MKPNQIQNAFSAQVSREQALSLAKNRMLIDGYVYPEFDRNKTLQQNYDAVRHYGELENKYFMEALRPFEHIVETRTGRRNVSH